MFRPKFCVAIQMSRRNEEIDGLRGWLSLSVCLYHGFLIPQGDGIFPIFFAPITQTTSIHRKMILQIINGDLAVTVFFIMSGAVLFVSLSELSNKRGMFGLPLDFMIRRLFRIFPALIVALCVFAGSYWLLQSAFPSVFHVYFTSGQLLSNLSLLRVSMYGVSWSLRVELEAVPFILLGFWLWRRAGDAGLAVYLALALLARDAPWLTLNLAPLNDHLFLFVLGMLAVGPVGEAATRKLRDRGLLAIPLITILGASLVDYRAEMVRPFQGLLAALFVAALLHGRAARIGDMLRSRSSQFLGRISYAFYVINPIFLEFNRTVIVKVFGLPPANFGSELLLGVSATACAVPLSALCYRRVELPGIRAGKLVFPLLRKIARRDANATVEYGERTQRP